MLGAQAEKIIVDPNNPKNVIVKKLALIVQGRDDLELDLSGDLTQLKKQSFSIKEGIQYKIRIEFFVQREIVHGLKYVQKTYRLGVPVDKMTHMVIMHCGPEIKNILKIVSIAYMIVLPLSNMTIFKTVLNSTALSRNGSSKLVR